MDLPPTWFKNKLFTRWKKDSAMFPEFVNFLRLVELELIIQLTY